MLELSVVIRGFVDNRDEKLKNLLKKLLKLTEKSDTVIKLLVK